MKKNKLVLNLITAILVIIVFYAVFFLFLSNFIRREYYQYKYNVAYDYIIDNPDELLQDFLMYSNSQGFFIGKEDKKIEFMPVEDAYNKELLNTRLKDLNYDVQNNRLYVGDGQQEFYVYINPNIIKDITKLLDLFAIVTLILFLLIVFIIYFYVHYKVVIPLSKISKYIRGVEDLESKSEVPILNSDDEIKEILERILDLEKTLKVEIFNRNEMLKSISHEFRTPLSHITTILWLYENQSSDYADFSYAKDEINKVIKDNKELIDKILDSLNVNSTKIKEYVYVKNIIEKQIELLNVYVYDKNVIINVDDFKIKSNPVSINLIINNILSNVCKYSKSYIKIYQKNNAIIFVNDFEKKDHEKGVGKTIIKTLVDSEGFEISTEIKDDIYSITLSF